MPSAQVKMVAGTGFDYSLLEEQVKMVAGGCIDLNLRRWGAVDRQAATAPRKTSEIFEEFDLYSFLFRAAA